MSVFFKLKEDMSNLHDVVAVYERDLEQAEENLTIRGKTLEAANREQPTWFCRYHQQMKELSVIVKRIDTRIKAARSDLYRTYKENYDIALGNREIDSYIDGDKKIIQLNDCRLVVESIYFGFESLVKAFEMRGYALKNITDARVHEINNMDI